MSLTDSILGRRLASSEEDEQRIGVAAGIPSLGLDGLSSAAYGPEAALAVLIPLGALGLAYIGPITAIIIVLLFILYFSYRQTIAAYPTGGGSYTVARENLGQKFGLLAAAALMLDYTLNVAVGISAGVGAIISAIPVLHRDTLELCLVMLGIITLANLRGVREAGILFSVPTYLFIASLLIAIGIGLARVLSGGHPVIAPPPPSHVTEGVGLWLLLRAFASGCTAMTGVEAVSNGVTMFAKPTVKNAQRTLTAIVVTLAVLLVGIAYLARAYGIVAMDENDPRYQSTISLLLQAIVGRGVFYYVTIASVLTVLVLSANTSYAGFPRLCRLVAMDDCLPHSFTLLGRRLVYSVGIAFLTGVSGFLLIVFGGITDNLIPLFAVGAFLAFTLSQAGMVMHWRKQPQTAQTRGALLVNGLGAIATAAALVVILVAKFTAGAWITVAILPLLLATFAAVKRHYTAIGLEIAEAPPLNITNNDAPVAVIPIVSWNRMSARAMRFGIRLSPDVIAVHVKLPDATGRDEEGERRAAELQAQWDQAVLEPVRQAGVPDPRLTILSSPYRRVSGPLCDYLHQLKTEYPNRLIAVIIPELVETHWMEWLLHNHRATVIKANLLLLGDPYIIVINVPWYFGRASNKTITHV
ncbi:MAG: APC family permease [Capsulimonadaceae bacterium]